MPVTMVMAMMMMPAVPPMMVMMPPMHFRWRQPGVLLNRRGGAGIAERQRTGALGRSCERACNKRYSDQGLHDGLPPLISTSEITSSNLAGFKANLRIETGPQ